MLEMIQRPINKMNVTFIIISTITKIKLNKITTYTHTLNQILNQLTHFHLSHILNNRILSMTLLPMGRLGELLVYRIEITGISIIISAPNLKHYTQLSHPRVWRKELPFHFRIGIQSNQWILERWPAVSNKVIVLLNSGKILNIRVRGRTKDARPVKLITENRVLRLLMWAV